MSPLDARNQLCACSDVSKSSEEISGFVRENGRMSSGVGSQASRPSPRPSDVEGVISLSGPPNGITAFGVPLRYLQSRKVAAMNVNSHLGGIDTQGCRCQSLGRDVGPFACLTFVVER
jgi:hypothetical protein